MLNGAPCVFSAVLIFRGPEGIAGNDPGFAQHPILATANEAMPDTTTRRVPVASPHGALDEWCG